MISPHKANCLYTVNIGNFLTPLARKSFVYACDRWGCDYSEILHPISGYDQCACSKFLGPSKLSGYTKLLYVDADTVISDYAPNIFELCQDLNTFYAVSDYQEVNKNDGWLEAFYRKPIDEFINEQLGINVHPPIVERFFNGGLFVISPNPTTIQMMQTVLDYMPTRNCSKADEQARFNVVVNSTSGITVSLLPEIWNHMIPQNCNPLPEMYINHFGGWAHDLLKKLS